MNRIEQMLNQASIEHCIPLFHRPHHCNITLPFHFSLTMAGTGATASQAWAILKRHARDEIEPLRLQELCRDNDSLRP
jgi:hypothetical protein